MLPMQKHILISHLVSIFSDLEIHQQIIELHKKENEIIQSKLLNFAKIFGISETIIHTLQYQKERNLSKISFLYSRLESFFQRENYFNSLNEKMETLQKLSLNLEQQKNIDCSTQSFFSNVNTNFSQTMSNKEYNQKQNQISEELSSNLRSITGQILDDVFYYSHDVVNYVKNLEFSNSEVYKNLNIFRKDIQKIGNF